VPTSKEAVVKEKAEIGCPGWELNPDLCFCGFSRQQLSALNPRVAMKERSDSNEG